MATGITKREQFTADALSVREMFQESNPLPSADATVVLSYPEKASPSSILQSEQRSYISLTRDALGMPAFLTENAFVLDDNLMALNELVRQGRQATLFYLDPPYGTGFDFQSRDLEHAYKDSMGPAEYVEFMRRRLVLIRECMTEDGSIYLHIGHQMLAHLKLVMDEVFGAQNFRNLITRRKCSSKNFTSRQYSNMNDFVLFYTKGRTYTWNQPGIEAEEDWILKEYPKMDATGRRYKLVPIHAPGVRNGETGQPWRGLLPPPGKHWQYIPSKLDDLDRQGDIHWSKNSNPRRKVYWTTEKRRSLSDYWDQYRDAHHQSIQITGYPTEKNFEMIKMIVGASSNPGDTVIDPFCGSGTTLQAARDQGRCFIGIDASFAAAKATLRRMRRGTTAMGDYVTFRSTGSDSPRKLSPEPNQGHCAFFTFDRLYDGYAEAVGEIAKI